VKVRLRVTVMKKPGVLDPEGKAIGQALSLIHISEPTRH